MCIGLGLWLLAQSIWDQFMCSDYIVVTSGTKKKWPYKTGDLLEEIQCIYNEICHTVKITYIIY